MKNKNFKRFKDDIKKTFTIYALVPVIIITFASYMISFSMWYRTVVSQNHSINTEVSKRIESIVSEYINKAEVLSKQDNIIEGVLSKQVNSSTYEEFYSFVNTKDIRCSFFVFDENMQPIIASSREIPEYAQTENAFSWGITNRMLDTPNQVLVVRTSSEHSLKQILSIGKAIVKNGKAIGYITFDLDERDLTRIISQNFSINVVVTDKYSNVISSTNALLINKFGKLDENFRSKSGFIKLINDSHYLTKSDILNSNMSIYTITSIGYFGSIFIIVGVLLIILFLMLTATTYLSAGRIANSKTKVIDEIIEAIENVQNGNLDMLLNVNTRDEFQIIAESYNQMLGDIKNLIEINKEKARQSVLSEIKQLESQFNPHFLFNTLEVIKYMAKMDPPSVNKIIVALSTLLRYSMNNSISRVILGEDLEYTKNYLLIQKYRFNKHFHYSINVEEGTYDCVVPKLIIQPIIENSIKYGFENKRFLSVKIRASFVEDKLVIVIYDDGIGMDKTHLEEIQQILHNSKNSSSHIGLFNVHRRIQLTYGEKYGIEILSDKGSGTVVKIILPINRSDDNYVESVNS